ncbi:MAG: DUF2933 domain-containing protein [Thermoplasmata archaeon]
MLGFPSAWLFLAILLLCPLLHLMMMSMQRRGKHLDHGSLENGG